MKLTRNQREFLVTLSVDKVHHEVAFQSEKLAANALVKRGLAAWSKEDWCWSITEAGRSVLPHSNGDRTDG